MIFYYLSKSIKFLRKIKLIRYYQCLYLYHIIKNKKKEITSIINTKYNFKFNCRLHEYIEFIIFMEGLYEKRESKLLDRYVKPGFVCLDVGANTGYYSFLLARKSSKVFSFEPSRDNYEIFLRNIKLNSSIDNIQTFNIGISSKEEIKELHISNDCCGNNSYVFNDSYGKSEKTRLTSINRFLSERKISHVDIVKIDVEGFENEVVMGATAAIESHMLKVILIEIKIGKIDLAFFNRVFEEYRIFIFDGNGLKTSKIDHSNNYLLVSNTVSEEFLNENKDILK